MSKSNKETEEIYAFGHSYIRTDGEVINAPGGLLNEEEYNSIVRLANAQVSGAPTHRPLLLEEHLRNIGQFGRRYHSFKLTALKRQTGIKNHIHYVIDASGEVPIHNLSVGGWLLTFTSELDQQAQDVSEEKTCIVLTFIHEREWFLQAVVDTSNRIQVELPDHIQEFVKKNKLQPVVPLGGSLWLSDKEYDEKQLVLSFFYSRDGESFKINHLSR